MVSSPTTPIPHCCPSSCSPPHTLPLLLPHPCTTHTALLPLHSCPQLLSPKYYIGTWLKFRIDTRGLRAELWVQGAQKTLACCHHPTDKLMGRYGGDPGLSVPIMYDPKGPLVLPPTIQLDLSTNPSSTNLPASQKVILRAPLNEDLHLP